MWLPLPHLLNLLRVQIDFVYRTGASAVAISVMAYGLATGAIAWIVMRLTGCAPGALVASAAFALNPNVLYLQATPRTEPLLIALTIVAVALLMRWTSAAGSGLKAETPSALVGAAFTLACLTWPVQVKPAPLDTGMDPM